MAEYIYNFTIDQFPNNKYDLSKLDQEIRDSSIVVSLSHLSGTEDDVDIIFRNPLVFADTATLSGVVDVHDGEEDYLNYDPVKIVAADDGVHISTHLTNELRDRSGKIRFHQTSRKLGLRIMWTGVGDDPDDPSKVGGGEPFSFGHDPTVSGMEADPTTKYIDFNCVENETWLHEGYITWKDAQLDTLTLEMVPRVTGFTATASGSYDLYGGYLVVPAMPGEGSIDLTTDITEHDGGLVYMPDNDLGESPTAFWDAEWNSSTQKFENIAPNPYGQGRYNMFIVEVVFARFMNNIPLLGSGFIAMNSSDTDQFGSGMRLKMIADTNTHKEDHAWYLGCTMCLHRDKSV